MSDIRAGLSVLSVCSGIGAPECAWSPLGWRFVACSEIEAFPSAVLAHHYPSVPNWGDMTKFAEWPDADVDVLVGGTPCQSFSVAGLRKGLADPRGNLALTYLAIADRYRPQWLVWENVPGVLSSSGGRDFGAFLGGLGELGYGWSYRVLDAQHFGIPQRRRRVFVVASSRGWASAAAVLFERESLSGVSAQAEPPIVSDGDWWSGKGRVLNCIDASYGSKWGSNQWYARGHVIIDSTGRPRRATVLEVERAFGFPDDYTDTTKESPFGGNQEALEFSDAVRDDAARVRGSFGAPKWSVRAVRRPHRASCRGPLPSDRSGAGDSVPPLQHQASRRGRHGLGDAGVGLPRGRRRVADNPRYKALGNSMAVPVVGWIGERIQMVDALIQEINASEAA